MIAISHTHRILPNQCQGRLYEGQREGAAIAGPGHSDHPNLLFWVARYWSRGRDVAVMQKEVEVVPALLVQLIRWAGCPAFQAG